MHFPKWAIAALGVILAIVLVILVWNKEPTIYPYLLTAISLASLVAFSMIGYYKGVTDKFTTIFLVFLVFLLLRNVQFISTHYGALMPGDVTHEYAVINTFAEEGKMFTIPASAFSSRLAWYSSWPLLHSFSLIFADVLGIKISLLPVILPTILGIIGFLFVYLLADRLTSALRLNKIIVPLCLLLCTVSPQAIYYGFKFVRNSPATVFALVALYLLHKYIGRRDSRILALIILNALVIVVTHHYTSFIFTIYLLAFAGLAFVLALVGGRLKNLGWAAKLPKFRKEAVIIGVVGIMSAASVFTWWTQVGTIIQGRASGAISRVAEVSMATVQVTEPSIEPGAKPGAKPARPTIQPDISEAVYPQELTPPWVKLLWARDFLIYAPVFFGFIWLIRRGLKKKVLDPKEEKGIHFVVLSLVCFGVFFLFEFFISHVETYRIVLLSLPFIALCSAILYVQMLSRGRWLKWLASAILVFAIASSFLGLWGHRYAPIDLYSSSVDAQSVGEATTPDDRHYALRQFVNETELELKSDEILSDDNSLLYLLLSPQAYAKIGPPARTLYRSEDKGCGNHDKLVVIDFGTRFHTHYWRSAGALEPEAAERLIAEYRAEWAARLNRIYQNGFDVWVR